MCLPVKVIRPDFVLKEGVAHGHNFAVVHNGNGYRCGYVKVEAGHPWHGKDYDSIRAEAHGGLTYARYGTPCDTGYWVGFDCSHGWDAIDPSLLDLEKQQDPVSEWNTKGTLWTTDMVVDECKSLCLQASKA